MCVRMLASFPLWAWRDNKQRDKIKECCREESGNKHKEYEEKADECRVLLEVLAYPTKDAVYNFVTIGPIELFHM
jgi:hypothetical protein